MAKLKPVTPGELLLEEFLLPMRLSQYRLAKEIGVPSQRIGEIVAGKRAVTAETDLRLCRFFGPVQRLLAAGPGRLRHRATSWRRSSRGPARRHSAPPDIPYSLQKGGRKAAAAYSRRTHP